MVTEKDILKIVETAEDFPTPSTAATQVAQMTTDLQVPVSEVAKLIMMDVGLSTKLLKVVNSSFYGLSEPISEVVQAINILGYKKVGSLALGLSVMDTFSGPLASGFDLNLFWEKSVCNAVSAGIIAERLRLDIPGEVFTAGLLQDIGSLFLAQYYPFEYGGAIATAKTSGTHLAKVERNSIGIDHAAVGAILSKHWNLSPIFEETIRDQHFVEFEKDISASPVADLIRVIHLSNLVTDVFYEEDKEERTTLLIERTKDLFGLGEKHVNAILEKVPPEMQEAGSTFELKIRLSPPLKKEEAGAPREILTECPRSGAKGLGKFCVECGESLIKRAIDPSNKRILIAEDSVATRRALAFVIKKMGYEVLEAVNGQEALDLAREHKPGMIMLDIMMPMLRDDEVLKILQKEPDTANVPIIMLTSLTDGRTVRGVIEAGANDYVVKPYAAETIANRVKKYLGEPKD